MDHPMDAGAADGWFGAKFNRKEDQRLTHRSGPLHRRHRGAGHAAPRVRAQPGGSCPNQEHRHEQGESHARRRRGDHRRGHQGSDRAAAAGGRGPQHAGEVPDPLAALGGQGTLPWRCARGRRRARQVRGRGCRRGDRGRLRGAALCRRSRGGARAGRADRPRGLGKQPDLRDDVHRRRDAGRSGKERCQGAAGVRCGRRRRPRAFPLSPVRRHANGDPRRALPVG